MKRRTLYHVAAARRLPHIMEKGLLPSESEKGYVFVWDSIEMAGQNLLPLEEGKFAIISLRIPESWVIPDDGYIIGVDAQAGHAFRVARRIPPSMLGEAIDAQVDYSYGTSE